MPVKRQKSEAILPPMERLFCLTGCTAVGKTELSLAWAEANDAEIVNCDSTLFYRGMDIGTAKPSEEERKRVRHHLIDILEVDQGMDVGRFVDHAIEVIREIQGRGKRVLVTGGSGFYLKAFFQPVVDGVVVSQESVDHATRLMDHGLPQAVEELRRRNPEGLGSLDTNNPRRVQKALERCIQTGETLASLAEAFRNQSNPLIEAPKSLCILERETDELNSRISQRVAIMLESGLVEEVTRLIEMGIAKNPSACNAIGYRETIAYLSGEYGREELAGKIATNTRRLAKKQRTWFRGQFPDASRKLKLSDGTSPSVEQLFQVERELI